MSDIVAIKSKQFLHALAYLRAASQHMRICKTLGFWACDELTKHQKVIDIIAELLKAASEASLRDKP